MCVCVKRQSVFLCFVCVWYTHTDVCDRFCFEKVIVYHRKNDPAAGSPTATLLRLLLPLLMKCRLPSRQTNEGPAVQQPAFCQPSETTTGGVYKWQGRNRHSLMSCAYETFLVARPIIAILGPNRVYVIPTIPRPLDSGRILLTEILFSLTL